MHQEVRTLLEQFDIPQLKQELLSRSTHALLAAAARSTDTTLAGHPALADIRSQDIVEVLRDMQKVIYGVDDRSDLFEVEDPKVLANAAAVVSLFRAGRVRDNGDGTSTLAVGKFGQMNSLCAGERFFDQPAGAFCTGFLVAPDVIATAGHCVDEANVTSIRFVFGFRMADADTAPATILTQDIYAGAEVIGRQLTPDDTDWCLVRLDRPVEDKDLVSLRRSGRVADNAGVYVIGHPSGLPAKFADGAAIRNNSRDAFFVANLDTYGGNSGSPVFNSSTHEVEGILVRGATDFVPMGFCMVSAVCPTTGCEGEACTRVSEFINLL